MTLVWQLVSVKEGTDGTSVFVDLEQKLFVLAGGVLFDNLYTMVSLNLNLRVYSEH